MGPIWLMGTTLTKDCVLKTKIILMTQKDVALYYNVKVYMEGFPIKMTTFEVFLKSPLSNETLVTLFSNYFWVLNIH
jgi:hypothetical protein